MELMWLVYAVENLTYGGSFWGHAFGWLLIITAGLLVLKGCAEVFNNNQTQRIVRRFTHGSIEEGDCFTLDEEFKSLSAGIEYQVTEILEYLDKFYVKGVDSSIAGLRALNKRLREQDSYDENIPAKKINLPKLPIKLLTMLTILSLVLHTVLPTRQTAIYMAGAYLIQEVVTSEEVQDLGKASYKAAISQLNKWSDEVPELASMLVDSGIERTRESVKTQKED